MVQISELEPGMKVRIVAEWGECEHVNSSGRMDKWLGQIMTVEAIGSDHVAMCEDAGECKLQHGGHWHWFPNMIDSIVFDPRYFEPASDEDFSALLGL